MRIWFCVALAALAAPCLADTLLLNTGETLIGKVVSEDDASVVFVSDALGKITVPRDRIQRLEKTAAVGAQAAPTPPAAQAAPPTAPAKKEDLFRMWWDQYLLYEVYQPITVAVPFSQGERRVEEDIRVSGRAGLKLSLDGAGFYSTNREQPIPGGADVRTFRLYTDGQFGRGPDPTLYKLEFGTVSSSFYMTSGWLRWQGVEYVHNVQAGYETVPQTLENIYAFQALTFMEASSMSLAFSPGNRLGVEVDRTYEDKRIYTSFGLYSIGSDPGLNGGAVTQTLLYPVMRVTGLPIYADRGKDDVTLLHLGLSLGYQFAKSSQFEFRSRPESFIAPYLVDTGEVDADGAGLAGLEAIYKKGPLTVTAETAFQKLTNSESNQFWGGYLSAGWFLTGEERGYDRESASVASTLVPNREFSWKHLTWGAWELAARYSYVDLNSGSVNGGRMNIAMLGLNWYWNRYMRWMFNAGYANVTGGTSPGDLFIYQARLQLTF
ncbi:MAG TPA: porin [Burkholderiales bacterium]|nr:porin [Burkholderiales bacterium]